MRKLYSALMLAALAPAVTATAAPGATPVPRHAPAKTRKLRLAPDPTGSHIGGAVLTNAFDPLPGATVFIKGT